MPYGGRVFGAEELGNLVDAALDFWLTHGRYAERFESGLARDARACEHCLLVNSGSSANLLAFMALTSERLGERRLLPGDEVITVAAGFPTTVAPIVQYGAVPVFVDVELATANVDTSLLRGGARGRAPRPSSWPTRWATRSTSRPCSRSAAQHGLWLIEDNCDALGSRYGDRRPAPSATSPRAASTRRITSRWARAAPCTPTTTSSP